MDHIVPHVSRPYFSSPTSHPASESASNYDCCWPKAEAARFTESHPTLQRWRECEDLGSRAWSGGEKGIVEMYKILRLDKTRQIANKYVRRGPGWIINERTPKRCQHWFDDHEWVVTEVCRNSPNMESLSQPSSRSDLDRKPLIAGITLYTLPRNSVPTLLVCTARAQKCIPSLIWQLIVVKLQEMFPRSWW